MGNFIKGYQPTTPRPESTRTINFDNIQKPQTVTVKFNQDGETRLMEMTTEQLNLLCWLKDNDYVDIDEIKTEYDYKIKHNTEGVFFR